MKLSVCLCKSVSVCLCESCVFLWLRVRGGCVCVFVRKSVFVIV